MCVIHGTIQAGSKNLLPLPIYYHTKFLFQNKETGRSVTSASSINSIVRDLLIFGQRSDVNKRHKLGLQEIGFQCIFI